jgi:hypothetical protein
VPWAGGLLWQWRAEHLAWRVSAGFAGYLSAHLGLLF